MKNNIISILIGCVLIVLVFNIRNLYTENINLSNQVDEQEVTIVELTWDKQNLISVNTEISDKLINNVNEELKLIAPLMKYDKQKYLVLYKKIMKNAEDSPETIYDVTTDKEFDTICKVVEAEIGGGDFDSKCNVASSIIERYYSDRFPDGWINLIFQDIQYSTVLSGAYLNVTVSQSTIDAIEYSFSVENTAQGCTYFHSGNSEWHEDNLEFVFEDTSGHKFYREKENN